MISVHSNEVIMWNKSCIISWVSKVKFLPINFGRSGGASWDACRLPINVEFPYLPTCSSDAWCKKQLILWRSRKLILLFIKMNSFPPNVKFFRTCWYGNTSIQNWRNTRVSYLFNSYKGGISGIDRFPVNSFFIQKFKNYCSR